MSLGYFAIFVPDTLRAKEFYHQVFGWTYQEHGNDYHHIDGSSPAGGIAAGAQPHIGCSFTVADAKQAVARVRELGGTAPEPSESDSGWSASDCTDGNGASFDLWQPATGYAEDTFKGADGDLFYFVVPAASEATKDFFGALFGWEYTPGSHPNGWNITNVAPRAGMFVGGAGGAVAPYFRVTEVPAAAERIRAAGGTAGDAEPNQAGWHAICRDNQGVAFNIGALRPGYGED